MNADFFISFSVEGGAGTRNLSHAAAEFVQPIKIVQNRHRSPSRAGTVFLLASILRK
jgi:hypothetical protein